jgi:serine/threonine protein kinase
MIAFACSHCGKKLSVKDELAGKKAKCPRCKGSFRIPPTSNVFDAATVPPPGQTPRVDPEDAAFLTPPQQPDEIGRFGSYRVLKLLGAGGMGRVYEAEETHLQRPVALKVMLPALSGSPKARERFLREARAAAGVRNDHIVTVYAAGEERGMPYLAMELLVGESLDQCLKRLGTLPVDEILRIGREMAEGLAAAHARGLVHRDIKPANVWLESREPPSGLPEQLAGGGGGEVEPGNEWAALTTEPPLVEAAPRQRSPARVKLLDFGLARAGQETSRLTHQGALVGTPAYMAPEQANRSGDIDHRCDLFSLGSVLYHLCTGNPPFRGDGTISTLMAVATDHPLPPHEVNPAIPRPLSDLVMWLLSKRPEDRPGSAGEVADALRRLANDPTQPLAPHQPIKVRRSTSGRVGCVLGAVAALMLLGCVGVATAVFLSAIPRTDEQTTLATTTSEKTTTEKTTTAVVKTQPVPRTEPIASSQPATKKQDDWVALWNSKDLEGWVAFGGPEDIWRVDPKEKVLYTSGTDKGWLMTVKEYTNFEVRLEYRLTPRAHSGLVLRSPLQGIPFYSGMKIQLWDDAWYKSQPKPTVPAELTGALFDVVGPANLAREAARPPGEWNKLHVLLRGRQLTVDINTMTVLKASLDDYKEQPTTKHPGLQRTKGHLGLQSQTGRVDFRDLAVHELLGN